ncbi:hypothetical protein MRA01_47760 [Methylobacterium radiotolerans]|nr:hypothetical protein MRA01_47760 [Methylobacterium radiotolerans]
MEIDVALTPAAAPHPKGTPVKTSAHKTAKLATDLVALARTGTDLDALDAGLAEARGQVETATRDRDAAEASYREQILDASPAELEQIQATKARAIVELDRAEALTAALTRRMASVRDDRERDARRAQHADAVAKCDAIRQRLPAEYRRHALALRGLLRDLAEAEVARELAEPLQADFGPIPPIENELRGLRSIPEQIIERTEVDLWAIDGRAEPMSADKQDDVQSKPGTNKGVYYSKNAGSHVGTGHPLHCTRRRFLRIRYHEAVREPWNSGSLLRLVNLPAFYAFGDDFVTSEQVRSAATALDHLSRELVERPEDQRPVQERFELVTVPLGDGRSGARVSPPLRSVA